MDPDVTVSAPKLARVVAEIRGRSITPQTMRDVIRGFEQKLNALCPEWIQLIALIGLLEDPEYRKKIRIVYREDI